MFVFNLGNALIFNSTKDLFSGPWNQRNWPLSVEIKLHPHVLLFNIDPSIINSYVGADLIGLVNTGAQK